MRTSILIAGKDLRQQLGNGTVLLFALVLPLGLAFLFSSLMGDPEQGFRASYVVADEDQGPAARAFVDDVLGGVATGATFEITDAPDAAAARAAVDDGSADAAFILPAGFSEAVAAGRTATLEVVGGADSPIASAIAREIAQQYATQVRGVALAVAVTSAGAPVADPAELAAQAAAMPSPLVLGQDPDVAVRELDIQTYYAAGMAVFFLFFVAMLSVSGILEERTGKTMARLLASPAPRQAILAGKLLGGIGIGLVAMTVLVGASSLLMGASWGPVAGVAPLVVALVLAATGLMSLVATFARTVEQATNWMSVLAVLMGLFGGAFVPLSQLGGLAWAGYATPHRWFLLGLSDLSGAGVSVVVTPVAVLLAFAVGSLTVTTLRIGKVIRP